MNPRYESDLIARALFDEFDERGRKVGKRFRKDNALSIFKRFVESKPEPELISAEDLAWVDSCLVAGPELPLENWVSFKEALVDSITDFSASYDENNAAAMNEDGEENGEQMEIDKEPEIANGECGDLGDDMRLWEVEVTVCTQNEFESGGSLFKLWDLVEEENYHELNTDLKWLDANDDDFLDTLSKNCKYTPKVTGVIEGMTRT